jgi:hypothetical protein
MGSFVRTEVRLLQALVLPKDLQMVLTLRRRSLQERKRSGGRGNLWRAGFGDGGF